ncbi:MAG: hypothetical protein WB554_04810 [Desulfomonilaceae bacterium]
MEAKKAYVTAIGQLVNQFNPITVRGQTEDRSSMNKDIALWVEHFIKPKDIKDIKLFIEGEGKKIYVFLDDIMMVVERKEEEPYNHINLYPLKKTDCCGLIMNHYKENVDEEEKGKLIPNSDISINFKISGETFSISSGKGTAVCLQDIFMNKILPHLTNIKHEDEYEG